MEAQEDEGGEAATAGNGGGAVEAGRGGGAGTGICVAGLVLAAEGITILLRRAARAGFARQWSTPSRSS